MLYACKYKEFLCSQVLFLISIDKKHRFMGLITSHPYHEIGIFFSVVYHTEKSNDKYFKNILKEYQKTLTMKSIFQPFLIMTQSSIPLKT